MATQEAAFKDIAAFRVHIAVDGMTREEKEKLKKVMETHYHVLQELEHESSRKICELGDNIFKGKIIEVITFPHSDDKTNLPAPYKNKTLLEKIAFLMADNAVLNIKLNNLAASREERRPTVLLLKDLGVKDENIMMDTLSKKVPYDEERKVGIITVKEGDEYKTPEAVVFATLYERYLKQLQTLVKE
jgi:hypothetical protein